MEGVDSTELERRPPPGKLSIIYAHGSTIINEYFVVPKGYYFYFDSVKSESTYSLRSGDAQYVDEATGKTFPIDSFDLAALHPDKRHLAIDHADFMHQYAPGDVMTNHLISFYPGKSNTSLTESELNEDGEIKFQTGIVLPNVAINPMDLIYFNNKLRNTYLQVLGPDNPGLIAFNELTTLYDLINIGIQLTNGDTYKLPPGHIALRSCRNLTYNGDTELYDVTRAMYNTMDNASKTLTKQHSIGMVNTYNNSRKPSNEPKTTPTYAPTQLFRPKLKNNKKHSMKNLMPLSHALMETALKGGIKGKGKGKGKGNGINNRNTRKQKPDALYGSHKYHLSHNTTPASRVYVTTYVRQEFASKIRYYNNTVLTQYEYNGLIPKPEFEDMYPMDSSIGKYIRIDPYNTLTPQQVYMVIMAANCHVCARNLAKLPDSKLCPKCHVVGFCEKHFAGSSRVTNHDCYNPFIKK
jgi:hypothetical protein